MVMDIVSLILNQTQDVLQFFPVALRIYDNELIPVLEQAFKSKQVLEYALGMRLMKCSIMIINNLGIGVNLFSNILQEADLSQSSKSKNQEQSLTWKNLIAFECIAIALNNPSLIKVFS